MEIYFALWKIEDLGLFWLVAWKMNDFNAKFINKNIYTIVLLTFNIFIAYVLYLYLIQNGKIFLILIKTFWWTKINLSSKHFLYIERCPIRLIIILLKFVMFLGCLNSWNTFSLIILFVNIFGTYFTLPLMSWILILILKI